MGTCNALLRNMFLAFWAFFLRHLSSFTLENAAEAIHLAPMISIPCADVGWQQVSLFDQWHLHMAHLGGALRLRNVKTIGALKAHMLQQPSKSSAASVLDDRSTWMQLPPILPGLCQPHACFR